MRVELIAERHNLPVAIAWSQKFSKVSALVVLTVSRHWSENFSDWMPRICLSVFTSLTTSMYFWFDALPEREGERQGERERAGRGEGEEGGGREGGGSEKKFSKFSALLNALYRVTLC